MAIVPPPAPRLGPFLTVGLLCHRLRPRASPTSDKQEGAVVADSASGHDSQGVQALVVLVQVAEGQ